MEKLKEEYKELVVAAIPYADYLVYKFLSSCKVTGIDYHDLRQDAYIGLIKATQNYNIEKGEFTAYASYYIKEAILKSLNDNCGMKPNRKVIKEYTIINNYKNEHPELTIKDISKETNIPLKRIDEITNIMRPKISLSSPIYEANGEFVELSTNIKDDGQTIENEIEEKDLINIIDYIINKLPPKERTVINGIYRESLNVTQVSKKYNIPYESTRRIHARGLRLIRKMCIDDKKLKDLLIYFYET